MPCVYTVHALICLCTCVHAHFRAGPDSCTAAGLSMSLVGRAPCIYKIMYCYVCMHAYMYVSVHAYVCMKA